MQTENEILEKLIDKAIETNKNEINKFEYIITIGDYPIKFIFGVN